MEMDRIIMGRPYGGVALWWHKRVEGNISPVYTALGRMVAVHVRTSYGNIWLWQCTWLWITVTQILGMIT